MIRAVGLRWTIGDVSELGFEALRLSILGARRLFGPDARYAVCVNTIRADEARARTGELPGVVDWIDAGEALPAFLRGPLGRGMAEGAGWKLAPPRIFPDRHEFSLDNDCILWDLPVALAAWLEDADPRRCLLAEDVAAYFGRFAGACGPRPLNAGLRGLPPRFDLEGALRCVLDDSPGPLVGETDEQGLQVAALSREVPPAVVSVADLAICSPFPPHLPDLGRCGAHFVGLNARLLPWGLDGRPAVEYIRDHWRRHREEVARLVGNDTPPDLLAGHRAG